MSDSGIAKSQPVILIGRGGGGTRLLSEMAKYLDVFLGNDLNVSFDSVEWVEKIYALAIEKITTDFDVSSQRDNYWRDEIRSHAMSILKEGGRKPSDMWGWKLPETTLIVPQIIEYFPQGRFVHLVRHPVTSCCRRTHMTSRLDNPIGAVALPAAYDYIGRSQKKMGTDPIHIHNAASWVYQVDIALSALETISDTNRNCLIKFENLCDDPAVTLEELKCFLGLKRALFEQLKYFVGLNNAFASTHISIDKERLKREVNDPEQAAQVWGICGDIAKRLDYKWPIT